jgi:hypothetical protein
MDKRSFLIPAHTRIGLPHMRSTSLIMLHELMGYHHALASEHLCTLAVLQAALNQVVDCGVYMVCGPVHLQASLHAALRMLHRMRFTYHLKENNMEAVSVGKMCWCAWHAHQLHRHGWW